MPQICIYIAQKNGVADDCATELAAAARKIDPAASIIAILSGFGPELDAACISLPAAFSEIWKIADKSLAYPNAELVRKALVKIAPQNSIVLLAHDHFGIDLAPGLSIKLDAAFVSDVVGIDGVDKAMLKLARQEFGGQFSTHVRCDISTGAVLTIRPGAFHAAESVPVHGEVVEKSI